MKASVLCIDRGLLYAHGACGHRENPIAPPHLDEHNNGPDWGSTNRGRLSSGDMSVG
jgi:hypothetical protein